MSCYEYVASDMGSALRFGKIMYDIECGLRNRARQGDGVFFTYIFSVISATIVAETDAVAF